MSAANARKPSHRMPLELTQRARLRASSDDEHGSPDSRTSELSIDELSTHRGDAVNHLESKNAIQLDVSDAVAENEASSVESKLHSNLKQQQEHYARQRRLLEELRDDTAVAISPTAFSSSSKSDDANAPPRPRSSLVPGPRTSRFELDVPFDRASEKEPGGLAHRPAPSLSHEEDNDVDEIERLQRKANTIAEYHARVTQGSSDRSKYGRGSGANLSNTRTLRDGMRQDTSNEALRKQLELLRRLQLENNRFRHENRSLREQNEVLEEQSALNTREIKRLKEEIHELTVRVQHDQVEIAAAAQNIRKIKQLQKQMGSIQNEKDQLQSALQEAIDEGQQRRLKAQGEIESMVQEIKHLKRSMRQSRQQEGVLNQRIEEANEMIAAAEKANADLKRQLGESAREASDLANRLSEKMTQIESIEGSATQCVERMEAGMDTLQKAHAAEREKRKKLEKLRDSLESQMATLETESKSLQDRVRDLEALNGKLEQRLQDWKLERKQEQKFQNEKTAEFQEKLKADTKTIGSLRDNCATLEDQLEVARASLVEVRKEVAQESNGLRKEVEALRNYIEDAQRAPVTTASLSSANDEAINSGRNGAAAQQPTPMLARQRREELWVQLPELQFLQGAVGGLRNETMNFVNEFQRSRHQLRQQAAKLQTSQEKIVELEHARSEDAVAFKELQDQRLFAEQAREIASQEKLEVLKWSQQTCEKNEWLEGEVSKCANGLQDMLKKMKRTRDLIADNKHSEADDDQRGSAHAVDFFKLDSNESTRRSIVRLVNGVERELEELGSRAELLFEEHAAKTKESTDRQQRITRLQHEIEEQRLNHQGMLAEVESLHDRSIAEKQQLFTESKKSVERERDALEMALEEERVAHSNLQVQFRDLTIQAETLEKDAVVFASIVHFFALFVPPLVLQVNDLLVQKRILIKENHEYALAMEQVECIGQVLRELVPSANGGGLLTQEEEERTSRRRRFRRVVIAVFAINRFQRGGFGGPASGTGETAYGVCTSLKPTKKKKASRLAASSASSTTSCLPPHIMVKVLPGRATLARLNLRTIVERLSSLDLGSKLRDAISSAEAESGSSLLGNLLIEVLTEMDPAVSEVVAGNTDGVFHCRALLERRRTSRRRDHSDESTTLSTVDLIRKRILALGKRLEDLHYQRNALQKENYEFQFQLEQQASQLKDMEELAHRSEAVEAELHQAQELCRQQAQDNDKLLEDKKRELREKEGNVEKHKALIATLELELDRFQQRVAALEIEKTELRREVLTVQTASAAEEEKLQKSRIGMDRQAEELRNLRQTAKRAHELHQQVAWQLEQELIEKASLKATIDHLRKQKETLEKEVYHANVRTGNDSSEEVVVVPPKATVPKSILKSSTSGDKASASTASCAMYDHQLQEVTDRVSRITSAADTARLHAVSMSELDEETDNSHPSEDPSDTEEDDRPRRSDSFRKEWQRLDMSAVFAEQATSATPTTVQFYGDSGAASPDASEVRRRGDEVEKVNTAVHDYMDRIDEKLQQMYGIPRSSSRLRPPSMIPAHHTAGASKLVHAKTSAGTKSVETRRSDRTKMSTTGRD